MFKITPTLMAREWRQCVPTKQITALPYCYRSCRDLSLCSGQLYIKIHVPTTAITTNTLDTNVTASCNQVHQQLVHRPGFCVAGALLNAAANLTSTLFVVVPCAAGDKLVAAASNHTVHTSHHHSNELAYTVTVLLYL